MLCTLHSLVNSFISFVDLQPSCDVWMEAPGLSDLLECPVCLETLGTDHKVLPCQHTFCTSCIRDVVAKLRQANKELSCPECRAPCHTPLDQLPSNVILNRILASVSSKNNNASSSAVLSNPPIPGNLATNPFLPMLKVAPPSPTTTAAPTLPPKPGLSPQASTPPSRPPAKPKAAAAAAAASSPSSPHMLYRAMYDYTPSKSDELELLKGQLYMVTEKCQDGWFKGASIKGLKSGVFPGNYVDPIGANNNEDKKGHSESLVHHQADLIDLSNDMSNLFGTSKTIVPPNTTVTDANKRLTALAASRRAVPAANPLPAAQHQPAMMVEKYVCTMSYPASSEYELELKEGDVVLMHKKRDDGW